MSIKPLKLKNTLYDAPAGAPKYPIEIKDGSSKQVTCGDPRYTRALLALMNLGAVNGGAACHWGGPAAMAECMSALHGIMFQSQKWYDKYNFINDIGHAENGIYALRANLGYGDLDLNALKGFRSVNSKLTGHGESHLYPEGVLLSNGPLSSSLAQAQGLAYADKLTGSERTTIVSISDGAMMEGEAKESLAAIAGLAKKDKMNPFVLILSDNNTKLSGRIEADSFDMQASFSIMGQLGWEVVKVEDGNNLQECYHALEKALELAKKQKPVFVWLKTIKGYGVKSTELSHSGGHGYPLKAYSDEIYPFLEEVLGDEIPDELKQWANELLEKPSSESNKKANIKKEKAQAGFARAAIQAVKEGYPVYSVSSDLQGSTGMKGFQTEIKEHFVDVGIAESNMIGHAAGMSRAGFIPIVDTFAAFGVTKGNLPLIMASLSSCPMIAVFSHIGFQDAADGASHQSLTYLSAVSSIPNTNVIIVSTSYEAETLMLAAIKDMAQARQAGKTAESYIFFVGRENFPHKLENQNPEFKKADVLKQGEDGVIVSAGPLLFKAIEAAEILQEKGHSVSVVNLAHINRPDVETIGKLLKGGKKLLTVEEHQVSGGMGAILSHALLKDGHEFKLGSLGVNGEFGRSAYKADELYTLHGLDTDSIVTNFLEL